MLAQDIDFHEIFKISQTSMALFTADLNFIDANEEFLQATDLELGELIGRNAFEVFPKVPYQPGIPKWTPLEAALTSGRREVAKLIRYDVEDPATPGVFYERYWSVVVTPVHGMDGQVEVLELSAREMTSIIEHFQSIQAGEHIAAAAPSVYCRRLARTAHAEQLARPGSHVLLPAQRSAPGT
jgi:PAS domain-containing protein